MESLTHRGQTAAHIAIGHREAGFIDGFLKDQVYDTLEPLLRVNGEVSHLLHQLAEHLWRQFVENTTYFSEKLLQKTLMNILLNVFQGNNQSQAPFPLCTRESNEVINSIQS